MDGYEQGQGMGRLLLGQIDGDEADRKTLHAKILVTRFVNFLV